MNYYQEMHNNYHENNYQQNEEISIFDNKSIFHKSAQNSTTSNNNYDPDYDMEVNQFLQEIEIDFCLNKNSSEPIKSKEIICTDDPYLEREQFEDYYDEFFEDSVDDNIPEWYDKMIQNKINQTKSRLEALSTLICYTCASDSIRNQIIRIEQDHNTPFCKLDYPRHPSFSKAWQNYWRFNCTYKCKVNPTSNIKHNHTSECKILLEHVKTGITTKSECINANEFPSFVMHAVELFQEFITISYKDSYLKSIRSSNVEYEKPIWSYIKLRSNYKNELMLISSGKNITPLLKTLTKYFSSGPGRSCNVVSLYCINEKWSQRKHQLSPLFITGCVELRDKIGPITINYNPKTNMSFNSVQAHLLGKIILDYLSPNMETSLIDIGCNYGVLGLMLAHKCDKVIGLYTLEHQVKMAEEIKSYNNLHNISFIVCNPKEVYTKCSSLIKKCIAVAVLDLASPFGKSFDAIKALRNLPSIWRVVVYGSFTKEFHKYIAILTSKNECIGNEFLPMQGSILDKSLSDPNEYDIVILFERKALIEPSIELIAPGPTVNIKSDIDNSWTSIDECKIENKHTVKIKNFRNNFDHHLKNPQYKPFPLTNRSLISGIFDSSSILQEKCESTSPSTENKYDRLFPSKSRESVYNAPPIAHNMKVTDKERKFNYPLELNEKSQLHCLDLQTNDQDHINSYLQDVKVKVEFSPSEKEDGELSPDSIDTDIKVPFMNNSESINFDSELKSINTVKDVLIKSEAISTDSNSLELFPEMVIKKETLSSCDIIKTKSFLFPNETIKTEPVCDNQLSNMKISPISDEDFENMVTPVSIPAALARSTFSPPCPISTNFTTVDGFKLSVKPNESFLSYKTNPDVSEYPRQSSMDLTNLSQISKPKVPLTTHEKKDEEVEFIKEQKSNSTNNYKQNMVNVKIEKNVTVKKDLWKSKDKTSKEIHKDSLDPDLRKLIEKRKNIKKQLDRDREKRKSKQHTDRSPSPINRKYKSSHSLSDHWNRFSSLDKYQLTLSPNKISDKRCKSSVSPNRISKKRYRSPLSSNKIGERCTSPLSSNRISNKRCKSPLYSNTVNERKYRLSLSPTEKCFKRSPESQKYNELSASPTKWKYRYNSRSRSPF